MSQLIKTLDKYKAWSTCQIVRGTLDENITGECVFKNEVEYRIPTAHIECLLDEKHSFCPKPTAPYIEKEYLTQLLNDYPGTPTQELLTDLWPLAELAFYHEQRGDYSIKPGTPLAIDSNGKLTSDVAGKPVAGIAIRGPDQDGFISVMLHDRRSEIVANLSPSCLPEGRIREQVKTLTQLKKFIGQSPNRANIIEMARAFWGDSRGVSPWSDFPYLVDALKEAGLEDASLDPNSPYNVMADIVMRHCGRPPMVYKQLTCPTCGENRSCSLYGGTSQSPLICVRGHIWENKKMLAPAHAPGCWLVRLLLGC